MACTPKKFKYCGIISCVCFAVFLALAIALPIVINSAIVSQAKDKAIMKVGNQNLWGEVPGDSGAQITRNFKFYNFTNPDEFLFENQIPEFDEIGDFIYQEYQNFTNYKFVTDNVTGKEKISYNFFQYFKNLSGDMDTKITTLNLGSLGAWYQFQTSPKKKVALQAMSSIIYTLEDYAILVASSQGIWAQFVKTEDNVINTVFKPAGNVPAALYDSLWNDARFGWKSWITLRRWILAAQNGIFSYDAYIIRDYFELSYEQLFALLTGTFYDWVVSIKALLREWYCKGQDPCDGPFFASLQLATQGITLNPPAGTIDPSPSIVSTNDTLRGCPEISFYLTDVFLKNKTYANNTNYTSVTFTTEWMMWITNHTRNNSNSSEYTRSPHSILHIGNIDFLFTEGEKALNSGNMSNWKSIQQRFNLSTPYHAHVFYGWVNYIADEFAMQKSRNGTIDQASVGTFLSIEMLKIYNKANSYLLLEVLSNLMLYNVTVNNISCNDLFVASSLNTTQATNICRIVPGFNESQWNTSADAMKTLIDVCWYKRDVAWTTFANQTNLTNMEIEFICDSSNFPDNRSFGNIKAYSDKRLHDFYSCDRVSLTCSQTEFTAKQWGNSSITRHVLPELNIINKKFINTTSLNGWEPELFPKPWEYYAVIAKYPNFTSNASNIIGFNTTVSRKLLTYERFFNQMTRFVLIDYNFNYTADIERLFMTNDSKAVYNYIKYMMITHCFYGFTQTRNVSDLLWGYIDPFITKIKNGNPQEGGDPSLPDKVSLVANTTYELSFNNTQSVYSGKDDLNTVRYYADIFGYNYTTFNDTYFDGNETYVVYTNPWDAETYFEGTDSFGNKPDINSDSTIHLYVTDLLRGGYATCNGDTKTYNGVTALRFRLPQTFMQNKTNNKANEPFHMDRWNGLLNLTNVKKLPLMMSKYGHLDLDEDAIKNVKVYVNREQNLTMTPSPDYDIFIDVEPYSGAGLSATLNLLANYEYKQDNLFSNPNYALLPVMALKRSGHWSDSAIDTQFGLLKIGLKLKLVFQILFYILAGLFLILCIFLAYKYRKSTNQTFVKDGTLLPSSSGDIKVDDRVL